METSGKWFPSLVRPANGPGYSSGTDHQFTQASYGWARFPGVSSTEVSLGPRIGPVGHQLPKKTGVKMWEPVSGLPEGEIRGELEGSHPCRVQKQKILEGGREGSDPCRVQE